MKPVHRCCVLLLVALCAPRAFASDFDGDGLDDLAVASSNAVTVMYGTSANGLATGPSDTFFPSDFGIPPNGGFGVALAAGDFDGDGFDDLAIGAFAVDVQGHVDAGCVVVMYGKPGRLEAAGAQYWTEDVPGLPGESIQTHGGASDDFGLELAAGDFDGDGFDDLAVADHGNFGAEIFQGEVTVIRGSASGLTPVKSRRFRAGENRVAGVSVGTGNFGAELLAGDLTGDGRDELLIWSADGSNGDVDARGAVTVLFGAKKGLAGKKSRYYTALDFGEDGTNFDLFTDVARGLAIGDFGDGKTRLLVSNEGHETGRGRASLVPMQAGKKRLDLAGMGFLTQDTVDPGQAQENGDRFSASFATGDFDDDGFLDLAIGSWGESFPGKVAAGLVQVVPGSAAGLASSGVTFIQGATGVPGPSQDDAWFGYVLSTGDFDGDGIDDLAVSAPFWDQSMVSGCGAVVQLLGSPTGLGSGTLITEPSGLAAFAQFGREMSQ